MALEVPLALSVKQVAEQLRVSQPTARRLALRIGVRLGRRLLVSRKALEEWLASHEGLPSAEKADPARNPRQS